MDEKKPKDNVEVDLAVIRNDLDYVKTELHEVKRLLHNEYVTKVEYEPVKKLVFGMVAIILIAVIGAIVALVVK